MSVKVLIAADLVPTESNVDKFISGDSAYLIGEDLHILFKNVLVS